MICSGFVASAFARAGVDLGLPHDAELVTPADLFACRALVQVGRIAKAAEGG
jgi:hypothetical protein